ncbi:hypothetical protein [Clostridium sp. ZBS15]|uniref:hypothetical protein n=1 Tax=Clostridium sp. ZBS15 TaxID=2949969 RepID=UPI002079FFBA|nr:hypothetical protein [Clostridium sp. ZBS15]
MNFEKDLREQMIQLLSEGKIRFNEQDSTFRLLISYLNVINRTIKPIPRKVFLSDNIEKSIKQNQLEKKYIDALLKFKFNFEKGIDMNGHLSVNIYYSDMSIKDKRSPIYRNSRDYLLDDWGIYHIHLNEKEAKTEQEMRSDKTNKEKGNRSKYLLFIKIINNEIYFIDIYHHNTKNVFSNQELLETLDRNWHFILEKYLAKGVASVNRLTNKEIQEARKNGSFMLYSINNKVYFPIGGGLNSVGTSIIHTNNADNILEDIRLIEEDVRSNYTSIKNQFESINKIENYNKELEFKFSLEERGYVVIEVNTSFAILYSPEGNIFRKQYGKINDKKE